MDNLIITLQNMNNNNNNCSAFRLGGQYTAEMMESAKLLEVERRRRLDSMMKMLNLNSHGRLIECCLISNLKKDLPSIVHK